MSAIIYRLTHLSLPYTRSLRLYPPTFYSDHPAYVILLMSLQKTCAILYWDTIANNSVFSLARRSKALGSLAGLVDLKAQQ